MASLTVEVPDLGDFKDVEIIEVLVSEGDEVEAETPLITLETDKATMDVPSSDAGRVAKLRVKKGDRVSKGNAILELESAGKGEGKSGDEGGSKEKAGGKQEEHRKEDGKKDSGGNGDADVEVKVPDLGDFKDVEIIEVLVSEGDEVELETPLITLETEKATMDVPSTAKGRLRKLHVEKGGRVSTGDLIATVRGKAGRAEAPQPEEKEEKGEKKDRAEREKKERKDEKEKEAAAPKRAKEEPSISREASSDAGLSRAHAGPAVRRLARELGVDLGRVQGSGVKSRITHDDVKAWVKKTLQGGAPGAAAGGAALPRVPEVDFASFGPVELKPLGRIQKISSGRLHASWLNLPHVTQHDEADITELEKLRVSLKDRAAGLGIKLTPLAFIARACAKVIAKFPNVNSSLDAGGQNLVYKKYLHLGFAADTPNGLVVPVIRDAARKDVYELARELAELAGKARAGKLSAAEMQGGCFTISSLGGIGGTAFTPIINAPEVAILGVSRSQQRPVWRNGGFEPRLMLPLSLSYDHRVIDGAEAVRFVVALAEALADPQSLAEAVP